MPAEPVTLRLGAAMAAGGDALGRLADGRVVFVEGGLPGEVVLARQVLSRRDYAKATVEAVTEASPARVTPPCPEVARGCGGCQWQHARPSDQLAWKVGIVHDAFRRIARMDVPTGPDPVALPPSAYRSTLRLAVGHDGRPSYRHRRSHDLLDVHGCLVAVPLLEDLLRSTRLRPGIGEVVLRVGVASGERLVAPLGHAVVIEAPVDAAVDGRRNPAAVHEEVGGRRWRVSAGSFFQSGPAAAEVLVAAVDAAAGALAPAAVVADLYAGVGLLGGVVAARRGARLVAVESSPDAAADAVTNLADLDAAVHEVEVGDWDSVAADLVVADPARSGLGAPGVRAVVATGAGRVVLVSCDPASGARDALLLGGAGYRLRELTVLDLFPHTSHVETVATFERP